MKAKFINTKALDNRVHYFALAILLANQINGHFRLPHQRDHIGD